MLSKYGILLSRVSELDFHQLLFRPNAGLPKFTAPLLPVVSSTSSALFTKRASVRAAYPSRVMKIHAPAGEKTLTSAVLQDCYK